MIGKKHKRTAGILCLSGLLAWASASRVYSQDPVKSLDAKSDKADKTDKTQENLVINVELVNVLFTVADRKGKLVTDLNKSDLKLYEDSKVQNITNFSRETDLPLTIALVVDTSTSI